MVGRYTSIFAALVLSACSDDGGDPEGGGGTGGSTASGGSSGSGAMAGSEGPGAFVDDFATSSDFFTRMAEPAIGLADDSPHNYVQIWYSSNLEPLIDLETFEAPVGSVAIKTQGPADDGMVTNIMVMIKLEPGSDASTNDWLYERRFADGSLDVSGGASLAFCAGCHNDWPETSELAGVTLAN